MTREEFDALINNSFQSPFIKEVGYSDWEDVESDYGIEHSGDILANALVMGFGPTPDTFYKQGFHDNLHGLMDPTFVMREDGTPSYEMQIDRGDDNDPKIAIIYRDGVFEMIVL